MGQSTPATIGSGIEIRLSSIPGGGNGLWTTRLFRRNELITEYCGPIIDHKKALQLRRKNRHSHIRVLNSQFLYIDGLKKPQPGVGGASFANDARNHHRNNSAFVSRHDSKLGRDRVFLKATQELPPGTEVFVSYGNQYWSCSTTKPTSPQKAKQQEQQEQDLTATGDQGAAVQAGQVHQGLAVVAQPAFGMTQQQQQQALLRPRLRSDSIQQQQEEQQPAVHPSSHLNWPGFQQGQKQQQQQESGKQPCSGPEPQLQAAAVLNAAAAAAAAVQASTTGAPSRLLPSHMQPMQQQQQQVALQSMACWSTHWPPSYLQPPVPYMLPGLVHPDVHPPPRAMPVLAQVGTVEQRSPLQAYFQQQQQEAYLQQQHQQAFFQQKQQHHHQQEEAYRQQQEQQAFFQQKRQQQQQEEAYFEQQQQQAYLQQQQANFQQQQELYAGVSAVQPVMATWVQQADAHGTSATRAGPGNRAAAVSALTTAEAAPEDLAAGVAAAAAAVGPFSPGNISGWPAGCSGQEVAVTKAVLSSFAAHGSREGAKQRVRAAAAASNQQQGYWQQPLQKKRHSTRTAALERVAALQPDNPYKKTYKTSAGRKKAGI